MRAGKLLKGSLIAGGAIMFISGAVNIYATIQLIGPTEERELGLSRADLIIPYSVLAAFGVALIVIGAMIGRKRPPELPKQG